MLHDVKLLEAHHLDIVDVHSYMFIIQVRSYCRRGIREVCDACRSNKCREVLSFEIVEVGRSHLLESRRKSQQESSTAVEETLINVVYLREHHSI